MSRPDDEADDEALGEGAVVIPITGELDLHAFAPRDVVDVVADYLDECRARGIHEVRLVHGRGKGVQRAAIRRLLAVRADVASFADALPTSGGWGATTVLLIPREKNNDPRGAAPVAGAKASPAFGPPTTGRNRS